jgi:hypothetical protein
VVAQQDVGDTYFDQIAAAQLAIYREIEQREVAPAVGDLQLDAYGPDILGPEGALLPDEVTSGLRF